MNAAGKSKAAGALGQAGSSIMRGAAGLLRAAGPIGAAFAVGMQVVDFFNSGKAAQTFSDVATFFGGAGAGKETTTALFKMSKQYREIVADFNIMEPIREQFRQRRDMMDFEKQAEIDKLGLAQEIVKDEYNMRFDRERAYKDFAHQEAMKNLDAEFQRRKTLFTADMKGFSKYIKIGERALQAIGSSTEQVFSSIVGVGKNLGASVGDMLRMSTAAQGVSKLLGSSAEDVLSMGNTFRLMNKTSLEVGTNLTTGIKNFADANGVMASVIMRDMKDSSEEIYKFSDGTAENFAKQAIALNKMGVSMNAMMKASDAMVLNYKDSIKAEMGLSAMLGKNVDLSETRAKLMAGDQAGAAESLRGALGGMDVGAMNAFQKQQLSQATGMDIEQLMSLQQGGEGDVKGTLEKKAAEKTGRDIANGALSMEIANDKKRMAADLAHQEAMMKFEQEKRKGMLFIEQMQRLENLAIEQKWRLRYAALDSEEKIEEAVGEMQKESASKLFNNLFTDNAKTFKDNLTKQGMTPNSPAFVKAMQNFQANNEQAKAYTLGLVQQGVLTSENASSVMADIGQKIAKGEEITEEYVKTQLGEAGAFARASEASSNKIQSYVEQLETAEAAQEKASLNMFETGLSYVGSFLGKFTGDDDFLGYGQKSLDKEATTTAAVKNLQKNIEEQSGIMTKYADLNSQYQPELKTIATNDHNRGIDVQNKMNYQAKIANAQVAGIGLTNLLLTRIAEAQGKPVVVQPSELLGTIGKSQGAGYTMGA